MGQTNLSVQRVRVPLLRTCVVLYVRIAESPELQVIFLSHQSRISTLSTRDHGSFKPLDKPPSPVRSHRSTRYRRHVPLCGSGAFHLPTHTGFCRKGRDNDAQLLPFFYILQPILSACASECCQGADKILQLKQVLGACDLVPAGLLLNKSTRRWGLLASVLGFGGGVYGQYASGQDVGLVLALWSLAVSGCWALWR